MSPAEIRIVQSIEGAKEAKADLVLVALSDLEAVYQAAELGLAIQEAETALPGWGWLVRENRRGGEAGGFFANLTSPDFGATVGPMGAVTQGRCAPTWADTPGMAVRAALASVTTVRQ